MLATLVDEPFSDEDWIYERKLDGERCLAFVADDGVRLTSRNQNRLNDAYPELDEAMAPRRYAADGRRRRGRSLRGWDHQLRASPGPGADHRSGGGETVGCEGLLLPLRPPASGWSEYPRSAAPDPKVAAPACARLRGSSPVRDPSQPRRRGVLPEVLCVGMGGGDRQKMPALPTSVHVRAGGSSSSVSAARSSSSAVTPIPKASESTSGRCSSATSTGRSWSMRGRWAPATTRRAWRCWPTG